MGIDPADLAAIRDEAADFLTQTIIIRRRTTASDGRGGITEDWYDLATVVGRLDYPVGDERTQGERHGGFTSGRLKVPYGTDLKVTDQVVVDPAQGDTEAILKTKTYEVTYVQQNVYDAYRQADVARIAGGGS